MVRPLTAFGVGAGDGYTVRMGHVKVRTEVSNVDGTRSREVEVMVDTDATYTFLPGSMLRELGIAPTRAAEFELASGETAQYARGEAVIRINGFAQVTPVVFGDDEAELLIGVVTLEQLELVIDPVAGALIPGPVVTMTDLNGIQAGRQHLATIREHEE